MKSVATELQMAEQNQHAQAHTSTTFSQVNQTQENKPYFNTQIEGSPFYALSKEKGVWHLGYGGQIVSGKTFKSINEIKHYIKSKPYDLIMVATAIFIELINKEKNGKVKRMAKRQATMDKNSDSSSDSNSNNLE